MSNKSSGAPELSRSMTAGQMEMISLGGAIGVGLFMGSTSTIKWTGPSVILAYALVGIVLYVVARILDDLKGLTAQQAEQVTIAYEPTWAIGSGESADPSQAEEGCYLIRQTLGHMFNETVAQQTRILYGGSITPDNIKQMMAKPDIDGVLVGGASLDPRTFLKLVNFND